MKKRRVIEIVSVILVIAVLLVLLIVGINFKSDSESGSDGLKSLITSPFKWIISLFSIQEIYSSGSYNNEDNFYGYHCSACDSDDNCGKCLKCDVSKCVNIPKGQKDLEKGCKDNFYCNGVGRCVECENNLDCSKNPVKKYCEDNFCVGCNSNDDCDQNSEEK